MNYMYQSFNFRGRAKLKPYYDLVANIATEELGHIELVAASINSLLGGPRESKKGDGADPAAAPLRAAKDLRNTHHFITNGQTSLVANSMG
jgi:Mn-containing catalase